MAGNIERPLTLILLTTFPRSFMSTFLPGSKTKLILTLLFFLRALAISFAVANHLLSKSLGRLVKPPLVLAISFAIKY